MESNDDKLWKDYVSSRAPDLREKIILNYSHLVKLVAGRLSMHLSGHVEFEDMIGYGIFGLIDAIDKFSPDKGVKFETYASLRIRGAIIDGIRKLDWVPRSLRQRNKQVENIYNELENSLGRSPSDEEFAAKLDIDVSEIDDVYKKSSVASLISLDDYLEMNNDEPFSGTSTSSQETPERQYDVKETKQMLAKEINKLSEKERYVISLYYFEELTVKEISLVMGVSESRISQIHSKAIFKLRSKLDKHRSLMF